MIFAETNSDEDARAEADLTQCQQSASNMRALIRPCLVKAGILTVAATCTEADSVAAIRNVTLTPEDAIDLSGVTLVLDGGVLALPLLTGTVTYSLRRILDEMFLNLFDTDVPGFEFSEGTLLWDVATDRITIEHTRLPPCGIAETQEY